MRKNYYLNTLIMVLPFLMFSGVNLKNGNFYVTHTDHEFNNRVAAINKIERTYNSRSTFLGLFGYGWGSDIETFLTGYPDGTVKIHENGGGGKTYFVSQPNEQYLTDSMVNKLLAAMIMNGDLKNSPELLVEESNSLRNNLELRTEKWDKYVKLGLLEFSFDLPDNSEWDSFQRGSETLTKVSDGFIRIKNELKSIFNNNGKLIKIENKNGFYTEINYLNGHINEMTHSDGTKFVFVTNSAGLIIRITSDNGISNYSYDGEDLISATGADQISYGYSYDKNHNLITITYSDSSVYLIEYEPSSLFVKSVTDRDGDKTTYRYKVFFKEDGSVDDDHYATYVTKLDFDGDSVENYYEYEIKTKANGDRFTYRIITLINGIKTVTTYDDLCTNPVRIERGSHLTEFEFDNRCMLVKKKSSNGDFYEAEYHLELNKLTKVNNNGKMSFFDYNEKGDLIKAKREDTEILLKYNKNGTVQSISQGSKFLSFSYDENRKPDKIEMKGEGKISIFYDDDGNIVKVESEEGHAMTLKVTKFFQELKEVVQLSGFDLGI